MSKVVLNDVAAGYNVSTINSNFDKIETALNNKVLYRDNPTGEPNELKSDLDFNGKNAYNVGTLGVSSIEIGGVSLEPGDAVTNATIQPFEFTATAGQTVFSVAPFTPTTTALLVEVNGVSYPSSSVATSGSNVTIPACELGDEVIIRVFTRSIGPAPTAAELQFIQTGAGASTRSLQNKLREQVSVLDFGATGNGSTNDTPAFQAAIDSLGAAGGSVFVPNGLRYLIDSNLIIKPNVTLRGPHAIVGSPESNSSAPYGTVGGALLLNSAATITLKGGASITGLLIHRKGMTFPAANSSAFAGEALIIDGDDAAISQCMILGFSRAIGSSGRQRLRLFDINIDCLSGVLIDNCADVAYFDRIHCWPFATIAALGPASSLQRSGNAFRFTTLGDWTKVTNCFAYGYLRGFWITNCNSMTLLSCSADSTTGYAGQIGFNIEGTSTDTRLIGCQSAAQEVGYRVSTSPGLQTRMTDSDSWACANHGVLHENGDLSVQGGIHRNTPNGITITSASVISSIDCVRFTDIASSPINNAVANSQVRIGQNNDYGNWPIGVPVVNNANRPPVSVASADPINLPSSGSFFQVTGTTSFGTLNGGWSGRMVTLKFTGALTVNDGGASLKLNGNFVTTADDTLTLIHDGTSWFEISRSAN